MGCIITTTIPAGTSSANPITTITVPSSGIWLATYTLRFTPPAGSPATVTRFLTFMLPTINSVTASDYRGQFESSCAQTLTNGATLISATGSFVFNIPTITSTTYIGLSTLINSTGGALTTISTNECYLQIVRIG